MQCEHTTTQIRWRNRSINMIGRQCLCCGMAVGQWLKHSDITADKSVIPDWDESLQDKWYAAKRAEWAMRQNPTRDIF